MFNRFLCVVAFLPIIFSSCQSDTNGVGANLHSSDSIVASDSSTLTYIRTIGDNESFGEITAARFRSRRAIVVLDQMNGRVLSYNDEGSPMDPFGSKGVGPGEFFAPIELALRSDEILVLDQGNNRISVLLFADDSLYLAKEMRLHFLPMGMCVLSDRIFVLGAWEGHLIHEIDDSGNVVQSFGAPWSEDPLGGALSSLGEISCSERNGAIALASGPIKSFWVFSADGETIWQGETPGFLQTIYQVRNGSFRPQPPEGGFWHSTVSVNWFRESQILVQLHRRSAGEEGRFEARIFDIHRGWMARGPDWPYKVMDVRDELILVTEANPFPVVKVYRVE